MVVHYLRRFGFHRELKSPDNKLASNVSPSLAAASPNAFGFSISSVTSAAVSSLSSAAAKIQKGSQPTLSVDVPYYKPMTPDVIESLTKEQRQVLEEENELLLAELEGAADQVR